MVIYHGRKDSIGIQYFFELKLRLPFSEASNIMLGIYMSNFQSVIVSCRKTKAANFWPKNFSRFTSWWFQPSYKILVKLAHLPKYIKYS